MATEKDQIAIQGWKQEGREHFWFWIPLHLIMDLPFPSLRHKNNVWLHNAILKILKEDGENSAGAAAHPFMMMRMMMSRGSLALLLIKDRNKNFSSPQLVLNVNFSFDT